VEEDDDVAVGADIIEIDTSITPPEGSQTEEKVTP